MTLDKRFKMWYHMTTNKAVGGHLMFKKVFILCLVCLLVVGGLCACQTNSVKTYPEKEESFFYIEEDYTSFKHTLGEINELDVGIYNVTLVKRNSSGEEEALVPAFLSVSMVTSWTGKTEKICEFYLPSGKSVYKIGFDVK